MSQRVRFVAPPGGRREWAVMSTEPSPAPAPPSGPTQPNAPGRYNRTSSGLVASLVVTVIAVVGVLGFMNLFRGESPEYEPEAIDYLVSVRAVQDTGVIAVYPPEVPGDWVATGVDIEPTDDTVFGLRFLTEDDEFVGIRVQDASSLDLVHTWVDEDAVEADPYLPAEADALAAQWDGFTDAGGDTGYVADIGERHVLVYGTVPAEELQALIDDLTTEPVAD